MTEIDLQAEAVVANRLAVAQDVVLEAIDVGGGGDGQSGEIALPQQAVAEQVGFHLGASEQGGASVGDRETGLKRPAGRVDGQDHALGALAGLEIKLGIEALDVAYQ